MQGLSLLIISGNKCCKTYGECTKCMAEGRNTKPVATWTCEPCG